MSFLNSCHTEFDDLDSEQLKLPVIITKDDDLNMLKKD